MKDRLVVRSLLKIIFYKIIIAQGSSRLLAKMRIVVERIK